VQSLTVQLIVFRIAPADIEAPIVLQVMSDGSVQLRLLPALDASVTHYYLVVVPDELAQHRRPKDFTLDEVNISERNERQWRRRGGRVPRPPV